MYSSGDCWCCTTENALLYELKLNNEKVQQKYVGKNI